MAFRLSPPYGLDAALEAHASFLRLMRKHEEFTVETDRGGSCRLPFWSETVMRVVAA